MPTKWEPCYATKGICPSLSKKLLKCVDDKKCTVAAWKAFQWHLCAAGWLPNDRAKQEELDFSVWNIPTCMYASLLETCCDNCSPISTHTFHLLLLLRGSRKEQSLCAVDPDRWRAGFDPLVGIPLKEGKSTTAKDVAVVPIKAMVLPETPSTEYYYTQPQRLSVPFAPGYRMIVQGTQCQIDGLRNLLYAIGISQGKQWVCRGTALSQLPRDEANCAFRRRVYLAILRSRKLDAPFDILERVAKRHVHADEEAPLGKRKLEATVSKKRKLEATVSNKRKLEATVSKSASAEGNQEDKGTDALDGASDFAEVECELQALDCETLETRVSVLQATPAWSQRKYATWWALRWVPPYLPLGDCPSMSKAKRYAATTISRAWQCRLYAARWALECPWWRQQTVFSFLWGRGFRPFVKRSDMEAYQRSLETEILVTKTKKAYKWWYRVRYGVAWAMAQDTTLQEFEEAVEQDLRRRMATVAEKRQRERRISRKDRFLEPSRRKAQARRWAKARTMFRAGIRLVATNLRDRFGRRRYRVLH